MKVLYDISALGLHYLNKYPKTGICRAIEALACEFVNDPNWRLWLCESSSFEILQACLEYWYQHPQLRKLPFLQPGVSEILHRQLQASMDLIDQHQSNRAGTGTIDPTANWLTQAQTLLNQAQMLVTQYHLQTWAAACASADLFHATYYGIPSQIRQIPTLVKFLTVYDLTPVLFPDFYDIKTVAEHVVYQTLQSIQPDQDWVICISESTKRDLCEYVKISPDRVFVAYLAADPALFYPCPNAETLRLVQQRYQIPNGPYLLSVSTLEPRKNLDHVLRCFEQLLAQEHLPDLNLVLVGSRGWKNDKLLETVFRSEQLKQRVHFTGRVADEDLSAVYSGALAFVYPSFYEGFGLPPLEAMQCGVPVITSNTSSLPEVVGDAGIMVDPKDADALCQVILDLYQNSSQRQRRSYRSLEQARKFSWQKCAQQTIVAYQAALASRPARRG